MFKYNIANDLGLAIAFINSSKFEANISFAKSELND
jgi:hypothetical protein